MLLPRTCISMYFLTSDIVIWHLMKSDVIQWHQISEWINFIPQTYLLLNFTRWLQTDRRMDIERYKAAITAKTLSADMRKVANLQTSNAVCGNGWAKQHLNHGHFVEKSTLCVDNHIHCGKEDTLWSIPYYVDKVKFYGQVIVWTSPSSVDMFTLYWQVHVEYSKLSYFYM